MVGLFHTLLLLPSVAGSLCVVSSVCPCTSPLVWRVAAFGFLVRDVFLVFPASTFPGWFIACLPYTLRSALHIACTPCQLLQSTGVLVHHQIPLLSIICLIKRLLGGAQPHCWFVLWLLGPTPQGFVTLCGIN